MCAYEPVDPNSPAMVHLTQILERLRLLLQAEGYSCELSELYPNWRPSDPGRDLKVKVSCPKGPNLSATVKGMARRHQSVLLVGTSSRRFVIAHSATSDELDGHLRLIIIVFTRELKCPEPS